MAQKTDFKLEQAKAPQGAVRKENISILVVDDDPLVVDFLQEYLMRSDYRVISAESGEAAISTLVQSLSDIVLVDLKMPGLDGLQTISKIAEIEPDIVTILMTGFPTLDSSVRAIRLGASDYILKPFKLDEIDLAVKNAIHEREVRREMKNLKNRVSELEQNISDKKGLITINQKVKSLATHGAKS
jgi:DNA-binding NtrC family response regulator